MAPRRMLLSVLTSWSARVCAAGGRVAKSADTAGTWDRFMRRRRSVISIAQRSVALLSSSPRPLLVPALVLTEVSYLLADCIGEHAELAFARALRTASCRSSRCSTHSVCISELIEEIDLPLGMVDASVIALAERRNLEVIATLDQRHFSVVRPRHIESFTLVP